MAAIKEVSHSTIQEMHVPVQKTSSARISYQLMRLFKECRDSFLLVDSTLRAQRRFITTNINLDSSKEGWTYALSLAAPALKIASLTPVTAIQKWDEIAKYSAGAAETITQGALNNFRAQKTMLEHDLSDKTKDLSTNADMKDKMSDALQQVLRNDTLVY
jgi:hypothetical protein